MTKKPNHKGKSKNYNPDPTPKSERSRKPNPFIMAVIWIFPPIYKLYMHFVLLTSKRIFYNFDHIKKLNSEGKNIVGGIWHQDGILAPFAFRNYNVMTMVSKSDQGEVMALILQKMGYIPFRGGSSMGGGKALNELLDFFRSRGRIFCGIAVDGSRGPGKKVKKGIIVIAKESQAPLFAVRVWAKRKILLPTWDRTLLPLPFNTFVFFCSDAMKVPKNACAEIIEAQRKELEDILMDLVRRGEEFFDKQKTFKEYPNETKWIQYGTDIPLG